MHARSAGASSLADDPVRMPQLVVDAIQALVEEVREQRRVTAPSAARLKSR